MSLFLENVPQTKKGTAQLNRNILENRPPLNGNSNLEYNLYIFELINETKKDP